MSSLQQENLKVAFHAVGTSFTIVLLVCFAFFILSLLSASAAAGFVVMVASLFYVLPAFAIASLITIVQLRNQQWPVNFQEVRFKPLVLLGKFFLLMIGAWIALSILAGAFSGFVTGQPLPGAPTHAPSAIP